MGVSSAKVPKIEPGVRGSASGVNNEEDKEEDRERPNETEIGGGEDGEEEEEGDDESDGSLDHVHKTDEDNEEEREEGSDRRQRVNDRIRQQIQSLVNEYWNCGDASEVALCIQELIAASLHESGDDEARNDSRRYNDEEGEELLTAADVPRQVVLQTVTDSFDGKERQRDMAAKLLGALVQRGLVTREQFVAGLQQAVICLPDLCLDIPKAPIYLVALLGQLIADRNLALSELCTVLSPAAEPGPDGGPAVTLALDCLKQARNHKGSENLQVLLQPDASQAGSALAPTAVDLLLSLTRDEAGEEQFTQLDAEALTNTLRQEGLMEALGL